MELVLCAVQDGLAAAFQAAADGLDGVMVHHGSIFDVACDAMVSPANSFGFMDGGIDLRYFAHFGPHLQDHVRRAILHERHGELLVGDALLVVTENDKVPYLIVAPTMRVPMRLGRETVNPYLAMRAVLLAVRHGTVPSGERAQDKLRRIAIPGLGTGVGGVPIDVATHQMREAILRHRDGKSTLPLAWSEASHDHQMLYGKNPRDLQHGSI